MQFTITADATMQVPNNPMMLLSALRNTDNLGAVLKEELELVDLSVDVSR